MSRRMQKSKFLSGYLNYKGSKTKALTIQQLFRVANSTVLSLIVLRLVVVIVLIVVA
jgi:hypothetical protein